MSVNKLPYKTPVKTKVLLVQLGSPKDPSVRSVRRFLKEFLQDPRVVDINPFLWKLILNLFVLPFRPARSARAYQRIWDGQAFPLVKTTKDFVIQLNRFFPADSGHEVQPAFLLCSPRVNEILDLWEMEDFATRAQKVLVLPQFPQYAESTIGSGIDGLFKDLKSRVNIPSLEIVSHYHRSKAFIDNSVKQIESSVRSSSFPIDRLVLSFHGIPTRRVVVKKDLYFQHCFETYLLIKNKLNLLTKDQISITFQSRFGSEEWLKPYTDETVIKWVLAGEKNIAIYCPSFVVDCLETTDEIGHELSEEVAHNGGQLLTIPCLNTNPSWVEDYAQFIYTMVNGNADEKYNLNYQIDKNQLEQEMTSPKMTTPPLKPETKTTLKIIFLTLFLDLLGFSIIFPLFPAMAKHYMQVDADNYFLKSIFEQINALTSLNSSEQTFTPIVLFGGFLGAIYSFLQFLFAPFWGSLSDRIGRRPVLLISLMGLFLSYVLWFFSGSFTLLILARFIGGIMAGNISTATAVVADITDSQNRSRGMAFVGIAFALGFILGPAFGGLFSMIDLTTYWPTGVRYGLNPFSAPALIAALLSLFNIFFIFKYFKESLPPEKRGKATNERSANPFLLLKPLPYKGVNLANFGHFLFLLAFSGMEFTLTFLAVERLSFSSMDNAYMFIFIGFIIALVQGGYVRRKAGLVGEQKLAVRGLILLLPGLVLIGFAHHWLLLYGGLFFLAVGSSLVIPCITSLVTLYSPAENQGKVLGIFRSLGALARVIGPILASLIYWQWGASYPYFLGALFLLIPIFLLKKLPPRPVDDGNGTR